MIRVLLTDDDNAMLLVECPTEEAADELGSAAIYSDGGVSAWRVPEAGVPVTDDLVRQLREGSSLSGIDHRQMAAEQLSSLDPQRDGGPIV